MVVVVVGGGREREKAPVCIVAAVFLVAHQFEYTCIACVHTVYLCTMYVFMGRCATQHHRS